MERAKVTKRLSYLKKIRGIVEIAKFDTLQKLAQTNKIRDHHYKMAGSSMKVLSFAKLKYKLTTQFSIKKKNRTDIKTLWVFITMSSKLIKTSYKGFNNMILKDFNKEKDKIIAIGNPAIDFANQKNLKIFMSFSDDENVPLQLSSILNEVINNNLFNEIKIVSKTPKIKNKPYIIFPITSYKENYQEMKKIKFYYSLPNILSNITNSYISNTIEGIFQESKRFFYQEKLVKHESSLKSIDERISKLKSELNKIKRKNEIEEIIQVTQTIKREQNVK